MKISKRINDVKVSPVRKLLPYAEKAVRNNKKIYYLNIGQPDVKTPNEFFEAINNYSIETLGYCHSAGRKELLDTISNYYKENDLDYRKEDILITNGGSEALIFTLMSICDEGDEILIPEPYYANYNSFFSMLQIKVNPISTCAESGFHLPNLKQIESSITTKTKAILISNPGNPTGTVYTQEEMERLIYIAEKYDLFIISDEVYRDFTYGNNKAISFGIYTSIKDRVIIIDSISKRYSACGARIGAVISKNKEFINAIYRLCQARLAAPTLEMVGAEALYKVSNTYLEEVKAEYEKRKNVLFKELSSIEGVIASEPEGAFYTIVKLPVDNAEKFIIWMLTEFDVDGETLMITPAEGFYATKGMGVDEVRISYAIREEDLRRAMNILRLALNEYSSNSTNSLKVAKLN
ncbi:pyridoxal phosphate-dependent aminotransferase [Niameybacter massiliensis]|uniref:pyridoxal phosphate-dependent aminotransferase n=1 Tax=Niameybacter massiliensis TaxID=1658108 RepID=UPI0006B69B08|nr:pyridoxal phosphate-dependent aminotransferase [Niameybacter massiliensis]